MLAFFLMNAIVPLLLHVMQYAWQEDKIQRMMYWYEGTSYVPRRGGTCLRRFAKNKGADQPAHPRIWSAPLLFAYWKLSYKKCYRRNFNILSTFCSWAGWASKPRRKVFSRRGPYVLSHKWVYSCTKTTLVRLRTDNIIQGIVLKLSHMMRIILNWIEYVKHN